MTYEAWRITFQSSEQAARSAYAQLAQAQAEKAELVRQCAEIASDYQEMEVNELKAKYGFYSVTPAIKSLIPKEK